MLFDVKGYEQVNPNMHVVGKRIYLKSLSLRCRKQINLSRLGIHVELQFLLSNASLRFIKQQQNLLHILLN